VGEIENYVARPRRQEIKSGGRKDRKKCYSSGGGNLEKIKRARMADSAQKKPQLGGGGKMSDREKGKWPGRTKIPGENPKRD